MIICVIATNATAGSIANTYDKAGRLTKTDYGNGKSITYTHDKTGNILERIVTVGPVNVDPIPDVKANGSDDPVILTQGDNLNVTLSLNPGGHLGVNTDWWIFIFYFVQDTGQLIPIPVAGFQSPLFDLSPVTLLNISGLPKGVFIFYFGIDMVPNGAFDAGQLYSDLVITLIR